MSFETDRDFGDEDDAERLETLSVCSGNDDEFWMLIGRLMSRRFQIEADEAFGFFRDGRNPSLSVEAT